MDLAGDIRRAWEIGRELDLTAIGYGRIHWDNERDVISSPFSYYFFLAGLVRLTGARRILEIGTHCGGSIRAMEAGLVSRDGASLVTVDVTRESDAYLQDDSLIHKVVGDANQPETFEAVRRFLEGGCDLLFIDATHDFWGTYQNYALYAVALRPKLVVFDDITLNPGMQQFWAVVQAAVPAGCALDATDVEPAIRPYRSERPGFGVLLPHPEAAAPGFRVDPEPAIPEPVIAAAAISEPEILAADGPPSAGAAWRQDVRHRIGLVLRMVRAPEWWAPKLSPLLGVAYLQIGLHRSPPSIVYPVIGALLVALACLAAYGHAINDLFDMPSDRAAGKPNGMAQLSRRGRVLILLGLAVGGILPWLVIRPGPAAWWAWAGIYVLLTVYSSPPLRFKERGFAGALTDAAMAHAVPTLFICLLFAGLSGWRVPAAVAVTLTAVSWAAMVGLRNILIGQIWDYENDLRSETVTFTVRAGLHSVRRLIRRFFVFEFLTLGLLLVAAAPAWPWLAPAVGLVVAIDLSRFGVFSGGRYDPAPGAGQYVPLHDLHQVWLPLMLSIGLAVHDWRFGLIPLLHVTMFAADIRKRTKMPRQAAVAIARAAGASAARRWRHGSRPAPLEGGVVRALADRPFTRDDENGPAMAPADARRYVAFGSEVSNDARE